MICNKGHRYNPVFSNLSASQGGEGRHKCAGCAYEQGYLDGFNGLKKHLDVNKLPDSQAGEQRHSDVNEAYNLGYDRGLRDRN